MNDMDQAADRSVTARSKLLDCLSATPYDEMIEFDLINNQCRNLYHTEGKYFVPMLDGALDDICRFAVENLVHPEDQARMAEFLDPKTMMERLRQATLPGILKIDARYKLLDGTWNWTRKLLVSGEDFDLPEGVVRSFMYDIQSEKNYEKERGRYLFSSVRLDARTGLPTDRDLMMLARRKIERIQGEWCLIAIDIEHFRLFADWHGQAAVDLLLSRIGKMLQRVQQDTDGLAGYRGEDDFWLLIPYDLRLIQNLYEELRELIVSQGNTVGFLPIFGICLVNQREDVSELFNHAALTAEQVKGDLHHRIRTYNPATYQQTAEEYRLLADFQRSLENKELFFCLQPQCLISNGKVVGAESLVRWRMPDGSMIPPTRFVPILEKYSMVTNLDKYIWERVCIWLRKWLDGGHQPLPISVNVSQTDILTIDVSAFFDMLLKKYDLPPELLKIEITESAFVDDTALARDTVRRLRNMGLMVLMDDFGSGYSSLNMLSTLSVDVLKLDAQFLHINKREERKGISILESVVSMAKTMSTPIIVEGVETQEQINFLEDLGCRYIQGYYFYRPMPVEEFERLISDERRVDRRGIVFKATNQIHAREFLDENVFSDTMLNNILGPVAIYLWKGSRVDIVRYNQQFYQMVGITQQQMNERSTDILSFFYPEDKERFLHMMEAAYRDRLNGAKGMVRVFRPNRSIRWLSVQLYFLSENEDGVSLYASCEDVTELQFVNMDLPGGYHRVTVDERMEFRYVSHNFLDMTGYTKAELESLFDNEFIRMVHPDDVPFIHAQVEALRMGQKPVGKPFRLRNKETGYIYVANQQIITDLYGELCLMGIVIDMTEVVKMRNSMQILADYSTDCIAFIRNIEGKWEYEVVVYGLEKQLGIKQEEFVTALNSGTFYRLVCPEQQQELIQTTMQHTARGESFDFECDLILPGGRKQRIRMKTDRVEEGVDHINYICVFHAL